MRVGVITFPGSLDERDAQRAVKLAPKASARERAYIHALEARFAANGRTQILTAL